MTKKTIQSPARSLSPQTKILTVLVTLGAVLVGIVLASSRSGSLETNIFNTRYDSTVERKAAFDDQRFVTVTAVAVATSDPNAPILTPKLPMGERCASDEQCATGNCVPRDEAIDGGPSGWVGTCGCRARPACLDANPRCAMAESSDMCVCGNGQCENGEKTSCQQDCTGPVPVDDDGPSCSSCLEKGMGFLCRGGYTGGSFCNGEAGGAGADFRCVACSDGPTKCVPEGQPCGTTADCGTCGAVCRGDGMTASMPPHIINGTCTYPRIMPRPSPIAMCDYAAPPQGCSYVQGEDYDPVTACGLILKCDGDPTPPPSCRPRPACLDTTPFCQMAEPAEGWCAPPSPSPETCQTCMAKGKKVWCHGGFYAGDREPTSCEDALPEQDPLIADAPSCEVCVSSPPISCPQRRGNVNCDDTVNIADLALLLDILLGRSSLDPTSMAYRNADANGDGIVDVADLAWVSKSLLRLPSDS